MKNKHFAWLGIGVITLAAVPLAAAPFVAQGADHIDSAAAVTEPTADITDVYAFMNTEGGENRLNLIMDVNPFAGADADFSNAIQYVFHVHSGAAYGADGFVETQVQCQFDERLPGEAPFMECWAGDEYVSGDPSDPAGLTNDNGTLRVFAGMRNDPFFMEFTGFTNAVQLVTNAASSFPADSAGCPTIDADTAGAVVGMLQSGAEGAPASDTFAGSNVLSLVVQVDPAVVSDSSRPLVAVWGSTHRAP